MVWSAKKPHATSTQQTIARRQIASATVAKITPAKLLQTGTRQKSATTMPASAAIATPMNGTRGRISGRRMIGDES
jgi:hypothetical protein